MAKVGISLNLHLHDGADIVMADAGPDHKLLLLRGTGPLDTVNLIVDRSSAAMLHSWLAVVLREFDGHEDECDKESV